MGRSVKWGQGGNILQICSSGLVELVDHERNADELSSAAKDELLHRVRLTAGFCPVVDQ